MPKRKTTESESERRKEEGDERGRRSSKRHRHYENSRKRRRDPDTPSEDDDRTSESDEGSGPQPPLCNTPDNHEIMEFLSRKANKKAILARERARAEFQDWEKKEEFRSQQSKVRSEILLKDGRAKPIDILSKNLNLSDDFDVEINEPYKIYKGLSVKEMEELRQDIRMHMDLDGATPTHIEFWEAMMVVCDWEIAKARKRDALDCARVQGEEPPPESEAQERGLHKSVEGDIKNLLVGKSFNQLKSLQENIESSGKAKVVEYWEAVLKRLHIFKAKARLREIHADLLQRHLNRFQEMEEEEQQSLHEVAREVCKQIMRDEGDAIVDSGTEVCLKSQVIQILGILDDRGSTWRERSLVETMYIDRFVGHVELVSSLRSSGSTDTSVNDWAMRATTCLFGPPIFRIGRVMAADDSYSGTGWFHGGQFVVTCAHVVHNIQHQNQDIVLQLPSDNVLINLEVVYLCSHASLSVSYLRDIAVLRMTRVQSPPTISLGSLPMGSLDAGDPIWAMKCVTAGVLKPEPQCQETQKMIKTGRVESVSEKLVTISARADYGFSGGPVLNKHEQIIGMVQGGRGQHIKTVAIIPIDKISEIIDVVIAMKPTCGLPPLPVPMQMGSPTIPY